MDEIKVSSGGTVAHQAFVSWINGIFENPVSGFWDSLVAHVQANFVVQKSKLLFIEAYAGDQTTLKGFYVFDWYDDYNQAVYFFDEHGLPRLYNKTHVGLMIDIIKEDGRIREFYAEELIPMYGPSGSHDKDIIILIEEEWGNGFPFIFQKTLIGDTEHKALLDVLYQNRKSSAYTVFIDPNNNINKYEFTNIKKSVFISKIEIVKGYTIDVQVGPNKSFVIPVTPLTTKFAKEMTDLGILAYRKL